MSNTKTTNINQKRKQRCPIKDTSTTEEIENFEFEIAKRLNLIPMGKVDYFTAKTLYHTPGFKEQKQKEMDEYFKNKEKNK